MLSDSQLLQHLHDVLRTSNLDTATGATVRRRLEQELGIDLSDRKPYIRQQIDLYLQSHYTSGHTDGGVDESENVKVEEEESDNGGSVSNEEEEEEDDDESDVEEKKMMMKSKHQKTTANAKKRGGGGFSKPCALSPQLQKFIGEPEMARTEVVKKIWAYIKEKDLQNPNNKRKIICDEMLHEIFRVKSIDMFQMNKALSKHIWPVEEEEATVKPSNNKNKQNKRVKEATVKPSNKSKQNKRVKEDEPEQKEKKKTKGSGFVAPLPISDELAQFFGTGESELSRSEVVKRMWEYIKQNDLQDPSDKRRILCDDKLKELFKVDTFVGFTVSKLLTAHFIKDKE